MSESPPRVVRRLLARAVPDGASGPSLLGDLIEEYASLRSRRGRLVADAWYVFQAVSIAVPYAFVAVGQSSTRWVAKSLRGLGVDLRYTYRGLR